MSTPRSVGVLVALVVWAPSLHVRADILPEPEQPPEWAVHPPP